MITTNRYYGSAKATRAGTTYFDMGTFTMNQIKDDLLKITLIMGELDKTKNINYKKFNHNYWHTQGSDPKVPNGRNGKNSPCSFISGTLYNLMFNNQHDLSEPQMNAIEEITSLLGELFEHDPDITIPVIVFL